MLPASLLLGAITVNLGLPALVGVLPDGSVTLVHAAVTGAAILLTILSATQPTGLRIVLLLIGTAQVLALAQVATQTIDLLGSAVPFSGRPIVLSEVAAIVAALAMPWLAQVRPRPGEILVGGVAGLGVTAAAAAQPWGLATIAIWTMAFSLHLPLVLYGAAVMSIVVTALALRRAPGGGELAAGLALVWLAGLKLDVSAYALMALAGLVIASRAALPGGCARAPAYSPARPVP
jgi:hypothetical protein